MPFPASLFHQSALSDSSIRWSRHHCKSYQCLNERVIGDCLRCFNMSLESQRWLRPYRGSLTAAKVMTLTRGTLR